MNADGTHVLEARRVAKPWGCDVLPAPFDAPADERIGEIWFEAPGALRELLAKYLFTSEALSVQVHPDDARAPAGARGKEECWLVLAAEPGARLAIGFQREVSRDELHAAALDGSVEELLAWHPVKAGDFFYLPAGTVHAIGAGVTIAEMQQNSDVTYRLYDYGRPRELHLDQALEVASFGVYPETCKCHVAAGDTVRLVDGPHFVLDHVAVSPDASLRTRYNKPTLVLPLSGQVTLGGQHIVAAGDCGWVTTIDQLEMDSGARVLLFTNYA